MTSSNQHADDAQRFTALYRAQHSLVRDFARRRVGADLAQEIVAETFLVAWRRINDIPPAPIPWLYRTALYEIANQRRRQEKALRLRAALVESHVSGGTEGDSSDLADLAEAVATAFATLQPRDQEILRLAAWEQLSAAEAATVLECSVSAYRMRLHRARSRLAARAGAREYGEQQRRQVRDEPAALSRVGAFGRRPLEGTELVL